MDLLHLLPRELIFMIITFLEPAEYMMFAVAYPHASEILNTYYKSLYRESMQNYLYYYNCCGGRIPKKCEHRNYYCINCRFRYCNMSRLCYGCHLVCSKCENLSTGYCAKCMSNRIRKKRVCYCYTHDTFEEMVGGIHDLELSHRKQMDILCTNYPKYRPYISELPPYDAKNVSDVIKYFNRLNEDEKKYVLEFLHKFN